MTSNLTNNFTDIDQIDWTGKVGNKTYVLTTSTMSKEDEIKYLKENINTYFNRLLKTSFWQIFTRNKLIENIKSFKKELKGLKEL